VGTRRVSSRGTLLLGWTLATIAMAAFVALGTWQLGRQHEKRTMLDAVQHVLAERRAQPLAIASDPVRARAYDWVEGEGGFAARKPLLLDNQIREGRPGVRVYRMFYPDSGGELLIDMGWLPLAGNRTLPSSNTLAGGYMGRRLVVRGLLMPPPSSGLALGAAMSDEDHAWLMARIDLAAIDGAIGHPSLTLAPRVLRLDPDLPFGHARDLDILPNTLPPERHLGYAVQWFALALAVLVTALVLTFRKSRR
jgi:surfeit locus 1 family protein